MWYEKLDFTLTGGTAFTITNAKVWQGGLSFEQAVSSDGQFELGGTHIGQMNVTLLDVAPANLIPQPYQLDSQTIRGVTITVNDDGSITCDGTATATIAFRLQGWTIANGAISLDPDETYILEGCPSGGSDSTYSLACRVYADGVTPGSSTGTIKRDLGNGVSFTGFAYISPYIAIKNGTVIDNLTFRPRLRLASDVELSQTDFTDATCVLSMSSDGETYEQQGVYTVVNCNRDNGLVNITAYDNMNTLSVPYETNLTFPSTYGAMANEITGQLLTFDGSTTAVAEKPEAEDLTKREVLGYIAQACGYNVLCNPQGYFQFVRYNLSGFSTQGQYHEISGLYSFHHSQYPVVITGVKVIVRTLVTSTDPDTGEETSEDVVTEYTAGTDAYQLVIEENPLITAANGQSVANALYALYGNVEFYTGDVSHISDLSIKASDIMKVTDRHNNTFPMLVSRTVISTGSAQNTSSYAEEPSRKIVVQPTQMSRIQNSVRQAAIDAQNGRRIASNTNQYFWHTESGTDTGAHITEIPREDFLADPTNGGGNLLARSNGVVVRDGLTELAGFTDNAFFVGIDNNTKIAFDTTNGLMLGENVSLSPSGVFKMKYGTQGSGDYYEFSVDVAQRYMYMNAIGNIMRMGADGFNYIVENGNYSVNAPDHAIVLQSYHAMSMSSTLAQLYLAYANGASEASLTADSISFTLPKGTLSANALFKAPGDTWTVDYAGGGYVTNAGKKFQWSVPTPYITGTVSVTALTGYIRQNGNYLVGSASVTGTFPIGNITVEKMTGFVRFTYDASSAPTGVVNNDVISVQLHIAFRVA